MNALVGSAKTWKLDYKKTISGSANFLIFPLWKEPRIMD